MTTKDIINFQLGKYKGNTKVTKRALLIKGNLKYGTPYQHKKLYNKTSK